LVAQILKRHAPQFPINLNGMTDKEIKEYHLKRLYELSLKSLGEIPKLQEPSDE